MDDDRAELLGRLFSLLTAKLEDAASVAADGQSSALDADARKQMASAIRASGEEIEIIAAAAEALAG